MSPALFARTASCQISSPSSSHSFPLGNQQWQLHHINNTRTPIGNARSVLFLPWCCCNIQQSFMILSAVRLFPNPPHPVSKLAKSDWKKAWCSESAIHPMTQRGHIRPPREMARGQSRSTSTALPTLSLISGSDAHGPDTVVLDRTSEASANMCETHAARGALVFSCEGIHS